MSGGWTCNGLIYCDQWRISKGKNWGFETYQVWALSANSFTLSCLLLEADFLLAMCFMNLLKIFSKLKLFLFFVLLRIFLRVGATVLGLSWSGLGGRYVSTVTICPPFTRTIADFQPNQTVALYKNARFKLLQRQFPIYRPLTRIDCVDIITP